MSSLLPAPVLEGARNCGSPEMQELLHDARQWVNPYPSDPWLGEQQEEAKQAKKRPKRRQTTSLGPLVSLLFSFYVFVTPFF
jgi:hypothetical protein